MAIEPVESTNTPNEGRVIINDNFTDLEGRINEVNPDGTQWYFGTGAPLDSVGFDGDMYYATDTQTAYGPKASGAWPLSGTSFLTPDATETVKGKAEIATQTETDAGTDDTRIVTPAKLASYSGLGSGGASNAVWDPVYIATTANITLSGTQTIDTWPITAGQRVLVKNQSTDTQNGIYVCASGAWSRATDASASDDFLDGKLVYIQKGAVNGAQFYALDTSVPTITLGSTSLLFFQAPQYASETVAGIAEIATQTETNTGTDDFTIVSPLKLTNYWGISKDSKNSVRVATTANITLSGTQTIDGVSVVAGNRVLVKNQSTGSQNGIYLCAAGSWTRTTDADTSAKVTPQMYVRVEQGTANANKLFYLSNTGTVTLGTTALTFVDGSGLGSGSVYRTFVTLGSDVVNATTSYVDVTGLSFAVSSGITYRFSVLISFDVAATTNGARFSMNGPAKTFGGWTAQWPVTDTTMQIINTSTYDDAGAASVSSPLTSGNIARIDGVIRPSASGTIVVRFSSEAALANGVTVKADSTLEWW